MQSFDNCTINNGRVVVSYDWNVEPIIDNENVMMYLFADTAKRFDRGVISIGVTSLGRQVSF